MDLFEGIIIRQINYKESSKIIHVFTETGMISLLVQGAKKLSSPFLNTIDSMNHIRGYHTGKGLMRLAEVDLVNGFVDIKSNLDKSTYVNHLFELILNFSESNYNHEKLYHFLLKILDKINTFSIYIPYCYMFESKYLSLLGIAPQWKRCVVCQSETQLRFSISSGGMCCNLHFPANDPYYSSEAIDQLKLLYYHDLAQPLEFMMSDTIEKEIRKLLDDYYLFHLGFQSKSRHVLSGLLGY